MQLNSSSEKLNSLGHAHYSFGPLYINIYKKKALSCMDEKELEAIYYLTESLCPSLRFKATYRFEKAVEIQSSLSLKKECIEFKCSTQDVANKVSDMLQWTKEMPQEWTLVQLTAKFNAEEALELHNETLHTNPLHLTVFDCGHNSSNPFCLTVDPPVDKISGKVVNIRQETANIIVEYKDNLTNATKIKKDMFYMYKEKRLQCNNRLRDLILQLHNWFKGWRCLLIGKLINDDLEKLIDVKINRLLRGTNIENLSKVKYTLKSLIKGQEYLSLMELKSTLKTLFPEDDQKPLRITILKKIKELGELHKFHLEERHPVILIIDEKLDQIPWHMMDVLEEHSVSRMPSLHFTYALFKEYEDRIENGLVTGFNTKKGTYIVNPGMDLKNMEKRLCAFFDYWMPNWSGIVGKTPSADEFLDTLTSGDIFVYNGHGDGTQFLPGDKIQRARITSLVLLLGCSSTKLTSLGPQVEMYGSHQMYLIACCPCVIGMLWPVTDVDCDLITTDFLSHCVPSNAAKVHWKHVDKTLWEMGNLDIDWQPVKKSDCAVVEVRTETQVLKALVKARKCARSFCNQAACVARGLPVKLN